MKSLIDTLVWIPTNSKYKNFNYILKEINNLKLKNFIYVITYNNFSEKISKIIDQKDYENFIYISKKEINIEVDNSFRNINKIHDYLLEHLNIKIKYFIINCDDPKMQLSILNIINLNLFARGKPSTMLSARRTGRERPTISSKKLF